MAKHRVVGLIAASLVLACLARVGVAADAPTPASKPASEPASAATSAPTSQGAATVWNLPAMNKLGCFSVADGLYAVVQDIPAPPPPPVVGQPVPTPAEPKWYLLDLKTGKVTDLLEYLKAGPGDFKGNLAWVDFCRNGSGTLLAHSDSAGKREPWWFDLPAKKGLNLLSTTGANCFWLGSMVIQYQPGAAAPGVGVGVGITPAKAIDLTHTPPKVSKTINIPGTVVQVSDNGKVMVCHTNLRFARRVYKPAYGVFGVQGGQMGPPVAGDTNPLPQFALSPGGKYLLATTYDDPEGGGIAGLSAKTLVVSLTGKRPFTLAQVNSPLFVNDDGRAMTKTDKGTILVWDAKGKESEELVKDVVAADIWGGTAPGLVPNLYYVTGSGDKWQLNRLPLPQMKVEDPKAKLKHGGL